MGLYLYVIENIHPIMGYLSEHIRLTALSVSIALVLGITLGVFISYFKAAAKPVLGFANVMQAVPSMALLGFAIPFLGIGYKPAIVVVVLYSLLPIIKNTYTGLENIHSDMLEAAKGIGLTPSQILFKVKLPLALPVIMAGVRVSAVTAVGLMTLAAFIGGGGLGYLVFSGIRTVNNYQILAGAIPACFLALFVDFLGATVENIVTPGSVLPKEKRASRRYRRAQKIMLAAVFCSLLLLFLPTSNGRGSSERQLAVGGVDYTEQDILCHLVAGIIEAQTDIQVTRLPGLGGTAICFDALRTGKLDLYVEYSGTAYGDMLKYPAISDVQEVYDTVKRDFKRRYDIEVLEQMGFNNTYAIAVRPDTAKKYRLKGISDLERIAPQLVATFTLEFLNRDDGWLGMKKKYPMQFKKIYGLSGTPRYTALMNGESDVITAFATDALLKKFSLVVLEDDKNFFPPYYAMPIIRAESLQKYPEIEPLMNQLGALLDNETMVGLNYEVDELHREPQDVAETFLRQHGLK